MCMLYTFAAVGGSLDAVSFNLEVETPYIKVNRDNLNLLA